MEPRFYWPEPGPAHVWLPGLLILPWTVLAWALYRDGLPIWIIPASLSLNWALLARSLYPPLRAVIGGALVVSRVGEPARFAPLAAAEAERAPAGWRLRWTEGRSHRTLLLKADPEFGPVLSAALDEARQVAAAGVDLPLTAREAARAIALGTPAMPVLALGGPLLVTLMILVAVQLLHQPLLLLGFAAIPVMVARLVRAEHYVLAEDKLWVLRPGQPARDIPLADITQVDRTRFTMGAVHTRHPQFPVLRMQLYYSDRLLRRLRDGLPR